MQNLNQPEKLPKAERMEAQQGMRTARGASAKCKEQRANTVHVRRSDPTGSLPACLPACLASLGNPAEGDAATATHAADGKHRIPGTLPFTLHHQPPVPELGVSIPGNSSLRVTLSLLFTARPVA